MKIRTQRKRLSAPEPPKTDTRKLGEELASVVAGSGAIFKEDVIKELSFLDAKKTSKSATIREKSKKAANRIKQKYSEIKLLKLSDTITNKVLKRNKQEFNRRLDKSIAIKFSEIQESEKLSDTIKSLQLQTGAAIVDMQDETLKTWTEKTIDAIEGGATLPELLEQFDGMDETRANQARTIARTQISSFNSLVTQARALDLGIEKAIWETAGDERVRESHAARDGKEFDLAEGLYSSEDGETLIPGVGSYNCRCTYVMVLPKDIDVDEEVEE